MSGSSLRNGQQLLQAEDPGARTAGLPDHGKDLGVLQAAEDTFGRGYGHAGVLLEIGSPEGGGGEDPVQGSHGVLGAGGFLNGGLEVFVKGQNLAGPRLVLAGLGLHRFQEVAAPASPVAITGDGKKPLHIAVLVGLEISA